MTDLLEYLASPATYGAESVRRIDTHASHVFLAGDHAYKLKRPVKFPFMDFSTLELREHATREEIRLNRRTAPELYLRAEAVVERDGTLDRTESPATGDRVVDWLVVMQRFSQDSLLSALADSGELAEVHVDSLRDSVLELHREPPILEHDWASAMKWVIDDNVDELRTLADVFNDKNAIEHAASGSGRFFDEDIQYLSARAGDGWIKRCHGDLHLGNVAWLNNRAVLFDALEFNESLATIDSLYDSAFLIMDLMARGLDALAFRFLNGVLDRNRDEGGLVLLPLYLATRAIIRAKVSAALARAGGDEHSVAAANHYLSVANPCLVTAPPKLVAIGGLSGTGKSTVAGLLGPELGARPGARWLRSDVIRKLQAGVGELDRLPDSAYGPGKSAPVYTEMLERAEASLRAGHSVILDAVFASEKERDRAQSLATALSVPFTGIWLEADVQTRKKRVENRTGDASDAGVDVVDKQESADLGAMRWHRVAAGEHAAATVDHWISRSSG